MSAADLLEVAHRLAVTLPSEVRARASDFADMSDQEEMREFLKTQPDEDLVGAWVYAKERITAKLKQGHGFANPDEEFMRSLVTFIVMTDEIIARWESRKLDDDSDGLDPEEQ